MIFLQKKKITFPEKAKANEGIEGIEGIGAEGLRISNEPLKAVRDNSLKSGNTQVNLITKELKAMNVKDLSSEEARRLKEARDLEDVLFS